MRYSKLSEHKFKKGKFITPINSLPNIQELEDEKSWAYGRMPEYLWIGLILKYYGREEGLKKLYSIVFELHKLVPDLYTVRFSQILKLDGAIQARFYDYIASIGVKNALVPLTIFFTESQYPVFAEAFYCHGEGIDDRCKVIVQTMDEIMNHQSHNATDIRFMVVYFTYITGKLCLKEEQIELLKNYQESDHTDEVMKKARAGIRAIEMGLLNFVTADSEFLEEFWRSASEMTECNVFMVKFPKEERNIETYMESLYNVFQYLSELFITTDPLNEKMSVLLGIATYSYKRLKEIHDYHLFNSITGRSCVRVLIEDYIMMKYLINNETSHNNIWRDYQLYGIGLYKLVLGRYREIGSLEDTHFDKNYIEALINEFTNEEFINMDTKYFDNQNIRGKAESVNEKKLYGLYYDYDSSFEHGMWGAIREASFLKCNNPAHKYHCVLDIENKKLLKTVMPDCVMVMNKTISFLDEIYGIPKDLLNEVINFEIERIVE